MSVAAAAVIAGTVINASRYNSPMPKFKVFLSHITVESTLADTLRDRLSHDFIGLVDVFVSSDRLSIPVGSKWLENVTAALREADLHLILCSPEASERPWIQFEAGAAHLRGIPIIPLLHRGMTTATLRVPLSEYEGFQICEGKGLISLYQVIADALGSHRPEIDFQKFANELASIEAEYIRQESLCETRISPEPLVERITNPKAVCISSHQFTNLGFENQLQIVLNAFPTAIPHQRMFSSDELRRAVSNDQKFDIVHVAAYVCPRTGTLFFSDVDVNTGKSLVAEPDALKADALAQLLQMAKVELVVIGSCDSIALALTLVNTCHVVAARDMVSPKMMAAWVEAFYEKLPQKSLSQALDFAQTVSQAPMKFYAKQSGKIDLVFTRENRPALLVSQNQ
jgi:hypothetical protein